MLTGFPGRRWRDLSQPPVDLDADEVFTALLAVSDAPGPDATVEIVHDSPDPLILVTEDDRCASLRLTRLVAHLNQARTQENAIENGIRKWVDSRPVSDNRAAANGVAVLAKYGTEVRWQVAVPRPSGVVAGWVPALTTSPEVVRAIRGAAMVRARALTFSAQVTGRVTVWTYLPCPALSPSVLTQVENLQASTVGADPVAVVATGRPVAVADRDAANRLVADVNYPHVVVPLAHLHDFGWM